jgi:predicted HicB family RNase H-like nuclease
MSVAVQEQPVARKKSSFDPGKRTDTTVKLDKEVAEDAKIAASYKGLSVAQYVTEVLRPIVARDIEEGHKRHEAAKKAARGN